MSLLKRYLVVKITIIFLNFINFSYLSQLAWGKVTKRLIMGKICRFFNKCVTSLMLVQADVITRNNFLLEKRVVVIKTAVNYTIR